jgi:hypothetical protein
MNPGGNMGMRHLNKKAGEYLAIPLLASAFLVFEPFYHMDTVEPFFERPAYKLRIKKPTISEYIASLESENQGRIDECVERLVSPKDLDIQSRWNNMADHVEEYEKIAKEYGIPREIFLAVPLIENEGKEKGTSRKGAEGRWQILPDTAKALGHDPEDIHHPIKAARIAAEYLKKWYEYFGSWPLSLAAYNYGPTRIIEKGITDFWEDYEKFPFETKETVRRKLAAAVILENPEKHNLKLEGSELPQD